MLRSECALYAGPVRCATAVQHSPFLSGNFQGKVDDDFLIKAGAILDSTVEDRT